MFEYIRALKLDHQIVQPFLSEFLAQLYIDASRQGELIMIIQHALLEESVPLARLLIKNAETESLQFQIGLDILKRLKEDEEVLSELLSRKKVSLANSRVCSFWMRFDMQLYKIVFN